MAPFGAMKPPVAARVQSRGPDRFAGAGEMLDGRLPHLWASSVGASSVPGRRDAVQYAAYRAAEPRRLDVERSGGGRCTRFLAGLGREDGTDAATTTMPAKTIDLDMNAS